LQVLPEFLGRTVKCPLCGALVPTTAPAPPSGEVQPAPPESVRATAAPAPADLFPAGFDPFQEEFDPFREDPEPGTPGKPSPGITPGTVPPRADINMPPSVAIAVTLVGIVVAMNVLALMIETIPRNLLGAGASVLGFIGLLSRHKLAWQWGRILVPLSALFSGLAGLILLTQFYAGTPALRSNQGVGLAPAVALLVISALMSIVFFALGTDAAREFFRLVCPRCGQRRSSTAADFLFNSARCKSCGYIWSTYSDDTSQEVWDPSKPKQVDGASASVHDIARPPSMNVVLACIALVACINAVSLVAYVLSPAGQFSVPHLIGGVVAALLLLGLALRVKYAWWLGRYVLTLICGIILTVIGVAYVLSLFTGPPSSKPYNDALILLPMLLQGVLLMTAFFALGRRQPGGISVWCVPCVGGRPARRLTCCLSPPGVVRARIPGLLTCRQAPQRHQNELPATRWAASGSEARSFLRQTGFPSGLFRITGFAV